MDTSPPGRAAPGTSPDFLARGGEMGARMRAHDWAASPLGPPETWPGSLRTAIRIMLGSRYAMWMAWGPSLTFFCNDAYLPTLGMKRDWALGARSDAVWEEIWPDIGPRIERVLTTGEATWDEALLLFLERSGFREETYHTFSYSPLADDDGRIAGMLCVVTEETERVLGERRLRTLAELAAGAKEARSAEEACRAAATILAAAQADMPFALAYLVDAEEAEARLVASAGVAADHPAAVAAVSLRQDATPWPLGAAGALKEPLRVDCARIAAPLPGGPWPEPATEALILPLAAPGQERPAGFLVCGINPRRPLDGRYRSFFELAAGHMATAVANARAYEAERRRAEALAALDHAKTAFFSNVSHEFRTPLTLMLGPLEEAMADPATAPGTRALVGAAHRNGLRLLRLVNTLLDFSRVEAGRARARFVPTDLAALTADLASAFRSACERAGLTLEVDCPPLPAPVHVDREMWEKIVLNLVSNAFKFTFEGGIAVSLHARDGGAAVELTVRDTGTGIPAAELPRLFDRFHRVEGAVGRTHEGSGIGLALVQELAKLHGGSVTVESEAGRGSTFRVTVPLGTAHLPADALAATAAEVSPTMAAASTAVRADAFVEEALRWLPGEEGAMPLADGVAPSPLDLPALRTMAAPPGANAPRVLVADDNADMRDYLRRLLLGAGYRVEAVGDGEAALAAARAAAPAVVLSDVMMPRLDGFGLLRALRGDPRTRDVPVLLLSARAGEEAEVEGLDAGADDYLVKPFSARELLARVGANLRMARLRREATEAKREGEARWRDLIDRMHEGFVLGEILYGADGTAVDVRYLEVNGAWEALTGLPAETVVGRRLTEAIPGIEDRWIQAFARVVETGEPAHFEDHVAPLGRWYSVSVYRTGPGHFGVLFLDVTERIAAAERQALLAREVDHRAKNALAVVQSVVRLTRADGVRDYARAVEGRVAALARAHTLLAQDRWRGTDLRVVVEEELAAYRGGAQVVARGPVVRLRPEAVQPLSMVLHELTTNAAKYGALSVPGGRVEVTWRADPRPDGALRLRWVERDGPPLLVPPDRRGFGSTLISAIVRGQLGGQAELDWRREGLRCEVTIAGHRLAAAAGAQAEPGEAPADDGPSPGGAGGTGTIGAEAASAATEVSLRGRLVLVAEDEPLVAMELVETLGALGCRVAGPAATVEEALRLAAAEAGRLSAAVLDVNLHGRAAFPVADLLAARGVPVVWATGYGELPPSGDDRVRADGPAPSLLRKPLEAGDLAAALRRALAAGGGAGRTAAAADATG
jgi:signal transduction histidine kinase